MLKVSRIVIFHSFDSLIVNSKEDKKKLWDGIFHPNEIYQEQIAKEFRRLARKYKFANKSKLKDLFVTINDYSDEAMTVANWKAIKEARGEIKNKYSQVWDLLSIFSTTVVFYYFDSQIQENEKNGVSERIKNDYYKILKKYDEFDYYTPENLIINFDSKENLDKNYEGNLFYYTR